MLHITVKFNPLKRLEHLDYMKEVWIGNMIYPIWYICRHFCPLCICAHQIFLHWSTTRDLAPGLVKKEKNLLWEYLGFSFNFTNCFCWWLGFCTFLYTFTMNVISFFFPWTNFMWIQFLYTKPICTQALN